MAVIQLIFLLIFATSASALDLKDATLQQLVESRPDIVEAIQAGEHEGTRTIAVTKDKEGRMSRFVEEHKDITGVLVGKRVNTYTYYPTGEVDVINQKVYRGAILRLNRDIKHTVDGKQPTASTLLEYVKQRYSAIVGTQSGKLTLPQEVTVLPDKTEVLTITGEPARAETRYKEVNVYDEEGEIVDTETVTILGHYLSATVDKAGDYTLSGVPEDEKVAIIYYGEKKIQAIPIGEIPKL